LALTEMATDIKDTDSTGPPNRETSGEAAATAQAAGTRPAPFNIRRRIGSTAYEVEVHFSTVGGETMDDKILRMVRGGAVKSDTEERK
jgi:hypothetical protein